MLHSNFLYFQRHAQQRKHHPRVEGEEIQDFRKRRKERLQELLRLPSPDQVCQAAPGYFMVIFTFYKSSLIPGIDVEQTSIDQIVQHRLS